MKPKEKLLILGLIIVLIVVIVIAKGRKKNNATEENVGGTPTQSTVDTNKNNEPVEEFVQTLEDGTKLNTSETLNSDKMVDGLKFENIQLTNSNGKSVLLADVTNTTDTATEIMMVDVVILDKDGNELGTVGGIIAGLQPGAKTQFNSSMTMDYANAYDFKIVKK